MCSDIVSSTPAIPVRVGTIHIILDYSPAMNSAVVIVVSFQSVK
jgi:hypothetical protein